MPGHYGKKKAAKKGLTAKQKTLPKALQQKIMKSKKKEIVRTGRQTHLRNV